jgi:hypothetical protein
MNIDELKEQLQEDIISYFWTVHNFEPELVDTICQIIVDRFNKSFHAPAPKVGA